MGPLGKNRAVQQASNSYLISLGILEGLATTTKYFPNTHVVPNLTLVNFFSLPCIKLPSLTI
jgi:hypothetical protein